MQIPLRKRTLGLLSIALLLIAGCSMLPTAPQVNVPGHSSPGSMSLRDPDGGGSGGGGTDPSPTPTPLPSPSPDVVVSAADTEPVMGLIGGVVEAGDFKVIVPPLAITGTATVRVDQPDVSKLEVDLSISPPARNSFNVPVQLVASVPSMSLKDLSASTIKWYNPSTQKWEEVDGVKVDLLTHTIVAPLWHFSQYKVEGRAGW
jgi:hypothetical protein